MKLKYKAIVALLFVLFSAYFSYWYSHWHGISEFAVYYRAAKIVVDPNISDLEIYNTEDSDIARFGVPVDNMPVQHRYSMFATYLMAPLALLDYEQAEAILIFLNLLCYAISIYILLKSFNAENRWFFYPFVLAFLWMPFIQNIRYVQINAILLLLMTMAVTSAKAQRYVISGMLMAVATLFKPFFLAVTLILIIRNWRIVLGYLPILFMALMLPGTSLWLQSFLWPPHPFFCYSALYNYLGTINNYYFYSYAIGIGMLTAFITYRSRHLDFFTLASFGLAGAFLAMPVLEANHLTILIFSYICFLFQDSDIREKVVVGVSFIMINLASFSIYGGGILYAGLLILWAVSAYMMANRAEGVWPVDVGA